MSTRDITVTVTVDEADWLELSDAAECAGMGVDAYVAWGVRLLAARTAPGRVLRADDHPGLPPVRRRPDVVDEPESAAWTETFAERLSHRADAFREV